MCIGVVLLPISLLITSLIVLCILKIIRTINSSSLIVTNYRRHRNSNANTALSGQKTIKPTKILAENTAEISSSSSSEEPEKRFSRQDTYLGTYFGMVNGKSILELENPENKVWKQPIRILFLLRSTKEGKFRKMGSFTPCCSGDSFTPVEYSGFA